MVRLTPEDRRYLTSLYDDRVPLPPGAGAELSQRNPRLRELREAYAALDLPVTARRAGTSRARRRVPRPALLPRRDAHHLALPRAAAHHRAQVLRAAALRRRSATRSGCSTGSRRTARSAAGPSSIPGCGRVSRDLLESVNEITFLERELRLSRARALLGARHRRRLRPPGAPDGGGATRSSPTTAASTRSPSPRSSASTTCATAACAPPRARGQPGRASRASSARLVRPRGQHPLVLRVHLRGDRVVGRAAAPACGCPTCSSCPTSPTSCSPSRPTAARRDFAPAARARGIPARRDREPVVERRRRAGARSAGRPLPPVRVGA